MPAARGMDELGRWPAQPLGYAHYQGHVRHTRGSQIGQPTRGAADLLGQSHPGQPLPLPLLVERGMELHEVPAQSTIRARVRKPYVPTSTVGPARNSSGARPSQRSRYSAYWHEVSPRAPQPGDRAAAERVIAAFSVELRGLIPQLVGQVVPAHIPLAARVINRGEERRKVECGESIHVSHARLPSRRAHLVRLLVWYFCPLAASPGVAAWQFQRDAAEFACAAVPGVMGVDVAISLARPLATATSSERSAPRSGAAPGWTGSRYLSTAHFPARLSDRIAVVY